GMLILAMAYFTMGMAYMQVFAPLFAKQVMGIGANGFALMMMITGGGALIGAMIIAILVPRRRRGALMLGLMALLGTMLVLFALSTYLPWAALTFFVLA